MNSNGLPPRRQAPTKSSTSGSKNSKGQPKKKKKGLRAFAKIVLSLFVIGILVGAGYLYWVYNQVADTGIDKPVPAGMSAKTKPITMLLLGTDNRPETGTYLSDVVMVASMNPETKTATIVSLPRDTRITLDGYKSNKLNSYYPRFKAQEKTSGKKAEDQMKEMMGKYLGVDINYTTVLNFQAFRDAVNAVGGVDVTVDKNMCYRDTRDGTDINLIAGPQHLDGKEALDFVRYRKSNCDPKTQESNDFDRNKRQNQVLNSMLDQMKSLGGVTKIGKVIGAVDDNMTTDVESEQMKNFISTYWDISKSDVHYTPVTGEWRSPYVYINETELANAKQALQDTLSGKVTASPAAE
ncbi:LCP family protein required for cell wall assembly [Paenibacillus amylolyticus]|uniref:LCP family protein required for cell wall assembly n=1 Tax=Paenibacillus amylolyticus TaxID=1451 RepID=A0AAP5H335_PAEAM|nr:LCP family protein [Paenibacillus amylolyticus]MDR6725423.1 LCP family protein required for cell wall assembly [Paenibacillus amylolyticus]